MKLNFRIQPRFTLAALLLFITTFAIPLAYIAQRRAWNIRRQQAYETLRAQGVNFQYQTTNSHATTALGQLVDFWRFLTHARPNELVSSISISNYRSRSGDTCVSDEVLQSIALFPETQQVNVNTAMHVTDHGLEVLKKLPKVICIQLTSSPSITGAFLEKIGPHPSLRTINLTDMDQFDGKYLAALEQLPEDLCLYLNGCQKINDDTTRSVTLPRNAKHLYLRYSSLGNDGLVNWLNRAQLWSLEIDADVTSKIATALAKQTKLSSLQIINAPLTDADLSFLADCRHLHKLTLNGLPIRGDFLKSLPDDVPLESLDLGYTLLTDKNAEAILRLKHLAWFHAEYTPLVGDFMKAASPQPELKSIRLCGVQLSEAGKANLVSFVRPTHHIALPENWSLEDLQRFPAGKRPWRSASMSRRYLFNNKLAKAGPTLGIINGPHWSKPNLRLMERIPKEKMEPIRHLWEEEDVQENEQTK